MKIQGIMLLKICVVIISLIPGTEWATHSNSNVQRPAQTVAKTVKKPVKKVVKPVIKAKQNVISFSGTYTGEIKGIPLSIQLVQKDKAVTGSFTINGEQATINGTVISSICSGKITEDNTNITYRFSAEKSGQNLNFTLLDPGQTVPGVKIVLKKSPVAAANTAVIKNTSGLSRNPSLIGTWRNTEVISSGSGEFYSSFSTDYFVKFDGNGNASIWTGKSAGGTRDVTIDAPQGTQVQRMQWYTEGKALIFVDPKTHQKEAISFYAEPNRMMLTGKNSKKVYQRVN
ncbi:hypothetical protein [Pedobacter psychroterrae]|uniref:Lipocalin-like protein n=1 Tax=Pedobacter psychroterrae TaxID=2530453 RepID=A0A4R0NRE6_9SPHI|nr:hypothetical protein [Pedobacter psychroterrae]TCD01654.1 hypothetical protein EZ437_13120 [Pedobacter psychroterrae]